MKPVNISITIKQITYIFSILIVCNNCAYIDHSHFTNQKYAHLNDLIKMKTQGFYVSERKEDKRRLTSFTDIYSKGLIGKLIGLKRIL